MAALVLLLCCCANVVGANDGAAAAVEGADSAGRWTLIFRQTVTSGTDWLRTADEWSVNPGDPSAEQYSILDQLESFRGSDGKLLLKLVWPGSSAFAQPQIWKQASNPVTASAGGPATKKFI